MTISAPKYPIWVTVLLMAATCATARADVLQENLIGCWSAAYEYDSLYNRDGSPAGNARLCSGGTGAEACGGRSSLHVTYCFDRGGSAYGGETHCWSSKGKGICHGSDGLSGSYRLQGNWMSFYRPTESGENNEAQTLAWACSVSFSERADVLEFGDCAQSTKTLFRDCDFSRDSEEYKTDRCELTSR